MMLAELDQRTNHGIEVTLLWDRATGQLFVDALDHQDPDAMVRIPVPPTAKASDVFHHPFAYAA